MNKNNAIKRFYKFVNNEYQNVKIVDIIERKAGFVFKFVEDGDDFPIDYPAIYVDKTAGIVKELSYLNAEDRRIIIGGA